MAIPDKSAIHSTTFLTAVMALVLALPQASWSQQPGDEEQVLQTTANASKNRKRQGRPVRMGTSGGNMESWEFENGLIFCSSATLGAVLEMQDGGTTRYFILSNNHIIARSNEGKKGESIVQPGLAEDNCNVKENNVVGSLSGWKKIKKSGNNQVDAAIAETVPEAVNISGKQVGNFTPSSTTKKAQVGMAVKKSGAGTGVTKGIVAVTNATVDVIVEDIGPGADFRAVRFTKQLLVVGDPQGTVFARGGDAGALLVENKNNCPAPVGLIMVANGTGQVGVANRIESVMKATKQMNPKGKKTIAGCKESSSAQTQNQGRERLGAAARATDREELRAAARAQRRVENRILDIPAVNGIGLSLDEKGRPVFMILMERESDEAREAIPAAIGGYPTETVVFGEFRTL